MIVGKRFIWLHFPKCAGHAVEQALRFAFRGQREVAFDAPDRVGWHDTVRERKEREPQLQVSDRPVICGFRRLPYWMLSRVHYEASRPPYHSVTRAMLRRGEFLHQNGQVGKADDYALHYGEAEVERWIRMEHLAEDFERQFGDILGWHVTRGAVRKLRRVINGTRLNYIRAVDFHFTPEELAGLYEANPAWAARERELYGDVLRLTDDGPGRFYFLNRKLEFVAASPVALDTWGLSAEQVIGRHVLDVFPLATDSETFAAHLEALRTMRPVRLDTISPTLEEPVHIRLQPSRAGLQVTFQMTAS